MRIPSKPAERLFFVLDLVEKCMVSLEQRKTNYNTLRNYFLFGAAPNDSPAAFNKIYPHIDQLVSFLYSAETTRFNINIGASVNKQEHRKIPPLIEALQDAWLDSNADMVFNDALTWALCFNSTFIKLAWRNSVHPFFVEPGCIGVLREDISYTDRQEALAQKYYITKSELANRLYSHPNRDEIIKKINTSRHQRTDSPQGVSRLITSQINPIMYGNVNLDLQSTNMYKPNVAEETVEMTELWVFDDETNDYQCITIADPGVIIYDRPGESLFLRGELPFVQICPNPQYDYYWGQSEVQRLIYLQDMRNKRMGEILDLLSKQVNPPTALIGFTGILDEKDFALNRAGGLLATDMPNAKIEKLNPNIPNDAFREINEIDNMFAEMSGISSVLQGRGESGVRSAGHASQLARLGSSRAKKRALIVEDSLEKVATLYLKIMQKYDNRTYTDDQGTKFIIEQFTKDFTVKVDAHSNSPIFMEDSRALAFNLYKAGALTKERLVDMVEPPGKDMIKEELRKMPQQGQQEAPQAPSAAPSPQMQRVK